MFYWSSDSFQSFLARLASLDHQRLGLLCVVLPGVLTGAVNAKVAVHLAAQTVLRQHAMDRAADDFFRATIDQVLRGFFLQAGTESGSATCTSSWPSYRR
jgi:hypothetical protein